MGEIGPRGHFEAGFEQGHAVGEVMGAHEARIALHTVGDAVAVFAFAGSGEFGEGNGEVAQEGAHERADVIHSEDRSEFGEFTSGRRHAGHGQDSPPTLAPGAKQKNGGQCPEGGWPARRGGADDA